MEEISVDI